MELYNVSAGSPPPGVTSNLENPYNQYGITVACVATGLGVTVPFVAVKIFTKAKVLKKVQYEDYMLVLAEAFFIAWCMLLLLDPNHNAHIWDTRAALLPRINRFGNLVISFYCPTILFAKCAAILQIQRIFAVSPLSRIWWTSQVLLWTCNIFYTAIFFACIFQCSPRRKIWHPDIPGTCLSLPAIMGASAITNLLLNLSILLLPIIALRKSQLTSRKKVIVFSVFSISFIAMIASIGRLVSTVQLADSDDWTFQLEAQGMWALGEVAAMVVASAVTATPAFVRWVTIKCKGGNHEGYEEHVHGGERLRRQPPRPSAEDTETMATEIDGVVVPIIYDLEQPLPPPLVPPKDGDYAAIEKPRPAMSRTRTTRTMRAPPPSPVMLREASLDDEKAGPHGSSGSGEKDSLDSIIERRWHEPTSETTRYEEQDGIIAAIIDSLRPARGRPHDTAQTI